MTVSLKIKSTNMTRLDSPWEWVKKITMTFIGGSELVIIQPIAGARGTDWWKVLPLLVPEEG